MAAPLSNDLRERLIAAWKAKEGTWDELAARFQVGTATVDRWLRRYRKTGAVDPKPHGGGQKPRIPDEQLPVLRALVDEQPDRTLAELREVYAERTKAQVGRATIGRALARLGLTRKKKPSPRPSATSPTSSPGAKRSSKKSAASSPIGSSSSTKRARTSR
jgi:transposase